MKLYFMIGLPTERTRTSSASSRPAEGARRRPQGAEGQRAHGDGQRVDARPQAAHALSVVRDGHARRDHPQAALLKQTVKTTWVDLQACTRAREHDRGVLARGDRTARPVHRARLPQGARFDSWEERLRWDVWHAGVRAHGVDIPEVPRDLPGHRALPWDHLDVGSRTASSLREYRKALSNRLSPPCGKAAGSSSTTPTSKTRPPTSASWSATTAASRATSRRCARSASSTSEQLTANGTRPAVKEPRHR
jgi:hypothetical protein